MTTKTDITATPGAYIDYPPDVMVTGGPMIQSGFRCPGPGRALRSYQPIPASGVSHDRSGMGKERQEQRGEGQ